MKVIIAGSRHLTSTATYTRFGMDDLNRAVVASGFQITQVVSGKEPKGIDQLGEQWANERQIPVKPFPASWPIFGKQAGPLRNSQMAQYAEGLLAIWDGRIVGCGTWDMINKATLHGLRIFVVLVCNQLKAQRLLADFESKGWERTPQGVKNWKDTLCE